MHCEPIVLHFYQQNQILAFKYNRVLFSPHVQSFWNDGLPHQPKSPCLAAHLSLSPISHKHYQLPVLNQGQECDNSSQNSSSITHRVHCNSSFCQCLALFTGGKFIASCSNFKAYKLQSLQELYQPFLTTFQKTNCFYFAR